MACREDHPIHHNSKYLSIQGEEHRCCQPPLPTNNVCLPVYVFGLRIPSANRSRSISRHCLLPRPLFSTRWLILSPPTMSRQTDQSLVPRKLSYRLIAFSDRHDPLQVGIRPTTVACRRKQIGSVHGRLDAVPGGRDGKQGSAAETNNCSRRR